MSTSDMTVNQEIQCGSGGLLPSSPSNDTSDTITGQEFLPAGGEDDDIHLSLSPVVADDNEDDDHDHDQQKVIYHQDQYQSSTASQKPPQPQQHESSHPILVKHLQMDCSPLPPKVVINQNTTNNKELLEFDGTTVLCRVCGDKASGFHYGVHSCEGCKGFFRRSIQQKIQYRPCTKNQQCSILRINRNRCQYCRLKKCIAVGMSRDAVRFGRVPKREKAKILAAMQKVNMSSMEKQLNEQLDDEGRLLSSLLAAHDETCDYTRDKVAPLLDRARAHPVFASCPSSMACPLNPIPQHVTDPNGGGRILEDFSERFSPAIRGVVEFAKRIPGFNLLSQDDQVTLLKAGVFEVLLVRLACMFDSQTNSMICLNGLVLRRESLNSASNARFLMDSMFDFAERLNGLGLSDHEIGLFCAVVVIAPDRPGLRNTDLVQKIHRKLDALLQKSVSSNHLDNPGLFTELKKKIPDLRTLNTLHSEKLLAYKMEPRNGGPLDSLPHNGAMMPERWSLNGHPSPNGSDWSGDSKELQDVNYGSPRSVSSSVASSSAEDMKSPQRSGSVSSGKSGFSSSERPYSPGRISSCPKRQSLSSSSTSSCPSKNVSSTTNGHVNGHSENGCSSGDESYFANDSPTTNSKTAAHSPSTNGTTATKLKRVDSPTDSGIESGKEHTGSTPTTSVCSSPRSAMDEKVKDVSQSLSDGEGGSHHPSDDPMTDNGHSDSIDDMPMLKRALQAPPLVSPHMLMDEAYRHHKKFRAVKRDPSPSTTTPCESLVSKHTTLMKTLEAAPRYFTEAQLKRTDLIQNIIMRSDQSSSIMLGGESSNRPMVGSHFPLQHQALTGRRTTDNPPPTHGYYIPTSYGTTNGCPYTTSNGRTPVPVTPRIMYSGPSSSSMVHHSNGDVLHANGLTNGVVVGQRRSPVVVGTTSSLSPHHSSALVMGGAMSPASLKSTPVSVLSHSPSLSVTRSPPSPAAIKQLSQSHHYHNTLPTDTLSDNLQPLNLSMSKRASAPNSPTATPPVVKMET